MLETPRSKEFLEWAGGERWAAIGTEFLWGTICLEQLSTDGHQFGYSGMTWYKMSQPVYLSAQVRYV